VSLALGLNAAGGLVITGLASELGEGLELARRSIQDGAALQKLENLKQAVLLKT